MDVYINIIGPLPSKEFPFCWAKTNDSSEKVRCAINNNKLYNIKELRKLWISCKLLNKTCKWPDSPSVSINQNIVDGTLDINSDGNFNYPIDDDQKHHFRNSDELRPDLSEVARSLSRSQNEIIDLIAMRQRRSQGNPTFTHQEQQQIESMLRALQRENSITLNQVRNIQTDPLGARRQQVGILANYSPITLLTLFDLFFNRNPLYMVTGATVFLSSQVGRRSERRFYPNYTQHYRSGIEKIIRALMIIGVNSLLINSNFDPVINSNNNATIMSDNSNSNINVSNTIGYYLFMAMQTAIISGFPSQILFNTRHDIIQRLRTR